MIKIAKIAILIIVSAILFIACEGANTITGRVDSKVLVDNFHMDVHEVTVAQYKNCVENGPCEALVFPETQSEIDFYNNVDREKEPIRQVSYNQALTYCEWVGGSLPTEAQWERACKGPDNDQVFPWGNFWNDTVDVCHQPNNNSWEPYEVGISIDDTNTYGIKDMGSNVRELVKNSDSHPKTFKGGSCSKIASYFNCASKSELNVSDDTALELDVGFRCVY